MGIGLSEFLNDLSHDATTSTVTSRLVGFMEAKGAHVVHAWFGYDTESSSVGTYPDWWWQWWWANDYHDHDHVAQHCLRRFDPILWGVDIDRNDPTVHPKAIENEEVAWGEFGLRNAIVFPVHSPAGRPCGGVTFGVSADISEFHRLLRDIQPTLHVAAMAAHVKMQSLYLNEAAQKIRLSKRERECLLWLSKGLRTSRIGERLGIKDVTVNLYISKAKKKLGVLTREQAVAKSIMLGIIEP